MVSDSEAFHDGGRALFEGLYDARDSADVAALVVQACRMKDRLDRLHALASGDSDEWARIEFPCGTEEGEMVLKVGGVLRELRQTELGFKQVTAEICRRRLNYDDDDDDDQGGLSDL